MRTTILCFALVAVMAGAGQSVFGSVALVQAEAQPPEPLLSSTLQSLDIAVPGAVDAFWAEMRRRGTPLVEPIDGSAHYRYVAFLWRGDAATRNVVLVCCDQSQLANDRYLALGQMTRLAGSDIWYRTYRLRDDARFTYRFSPNDSLTLTPDSTDAANAARSAAIQSDPLNPRQVPTRNGQAALLELPSAPPDLWTARRPSISHGQVEPSRFTSRLLSDQRDVWVYTPPGDACRRVRCDLLVVLDGDGYLGDIPVSTILDNLLAARRVRPTVAVLVGNADGARLKQLWMDETFNHFLIDELLPWVRAHYRVARDASRTVIAGSSLGATAAMFAGVEHPEVFGGVLAQSGGFAATRTREESWPQRVEPGQLFEDEFPEYEWLAHRIATAHQATTKIYLEIGLIEDVPWTPSRPRYAYPSNVIATRHLRDVLEARGFGVTYHEFNGHHEHHAWRVTFADGLMALLGNPRS